MAELTPFRYAGPGLHSHNRKRYVSNDRARGTAQVFLSVVLGLLGIAALGYYAYTLADERVYQAYANWEFEQQIAGRANATFRDYVRERTPFRFLAGEKSSEPMPKPAPSVEGMPPPNGSIIGRVAISRLHLSAVVRQGVDDKTLSDSVGHVPSTALAGQTGNFAIAAHRDTLFRVLKDIQKDDVIDFQSAAGTFAYKVAATRIVRPTDVSVLRPDGGGMIQTPAGSPPPKLLTMITCYPFYFVGSAPKRFIVEAELVTPGGPGIALSKTGEMVK